GHARLVRVTTPAFEPVSCPSTAGLRPFDAAARKTAISTAEIVDRSFARGLRLTDPSWWGGYYTDQIDGRYDWGRHRVHSVGPASADPYSSAVVERCGAALVRDSVAIVVGRGVYSD